MDALYFGITVHFRGTLSRTKNVNPVSYTYIDLLDDVAEKSLSTVPCGSGCMIRFKRKITESNETMVVHCDLVVLDMFRLNSRTCQIELIVHVGEYGGTLELGGEEGVRNEVIDLGDTYDVVEFKSVRKRNNVTRHEHYDYLASLDSDEDASDAGGV
ncbi:hypothetical protein RHGRI_007362 [Rhododendron griersonianum]|uniref:Uncharacterized protein n=1 Tax=Rhododendron griersonianum TaxID=479676 RepID=A0AAV6KWQ8_9ERIC|nr:hypothetical protein RHGRI_007362 [Rhododendron griersonianum]